MQAATRTGPIPNGWRSRGARVGADARGTLVLRIEESLEGGRAAVLRPERRRRLLRIARMLGVREFDAHLLIAQAQERARRGETLSGEVVGGGGAAPARESAAWWLLAMALTLGLLGFGALRAWVGI